MKLIKLEGAWKKYEGSLKMYKGTDFRDYLARKLESKEYERGFYRSLLAARVASDVCSFRTSRNISQAELAELAGTSQPSIARIEGGRYGRFSVRTLINIAEALDTELVISFREKTHHERVGEEGARRYSVMVKHLALTQPPEESLYQPILCKSTEGIKMTATQEEGVG